MTNWFSNYEPFDELTTPKRFHDLGKLMHGFIVLWAYASFSQFLIIWSANLPEEIPWYLHRIRNGWQIIGIGLMIFHFFVPFETMLLVCSMRGRPPIIMFQVTETSIFTNAAVARSVARESVVTVPFGKRVNWVYPPGGGSVGGIVHLLILTTSVAFLENDVGGLTPPGSGGV
jgi:hypothetical protein